MSVSRYVGKLQEHRVERSGQFRRFEDGHVVAGERLGVGCRRGGEGVARLELGDHVEEDPLEQLVGRLLGDQLQGLHDRDARFDEDAQLAREVHDLLALDRLLRDLELEDALVLLDVDRLQPALNAA